MSVAFGPGGPNGPVNPSVACQTDGFTAHFCVAATATTDEEKEFAYASLTSDKINDVVNLTFSYYQKIKFLPIDGFNNLHVEKNRIAAENIISSDLAIFKVSDLNRLAQNVKQVIVKFRVPRDGLFTEQALTQGISLFCKKVFPNLNPIESAFILQCGLQNKLLNDKFV